MTKPSVLGLDAHRLHTAAIILAAGSSSRMGQSKQLLPIGDEKLLARTVRTFIAAKLKRIVVVLGANEAEHRTCISGFPIDIVTNERWQTGMGSSIKAGMSHLATDLDIHNVVISVCDQPLISTQLIAALFLSKAQSGKGLVASQYADIAGVPVLFHRNYFAALRNLPDDQGAKIILQHNASDVALVPFPGGEVDLDTPDQYRSFMDAD